MNHAKPCQRVRHAGTITIICALFAVGAHASEDANAGLDLRPIERSAWNTDAARHLLSRAGFGGQSNEVERLGRLTPRKAVASLFSDKPPPGSFDHSGVFEPGLDPFPPSRPATTELARRQGHALGVQVRPHGNRPMQGVVNKFFYWLRASRLETDRVAYWWAEQMLTNPHPLQEKMALFWHGHFATNEDKVRDYRKMLKQLQLFRQQGLGNFRNLMVGVAQDPAMLVFLDAGVNTKTAPNENFAREIMELFTMGVGHYGEADVREAARAFTGWNVADLEFVLVASDHDGDAKTVLGHTGRFGGEEVIDIILAHEATADFLAAKLYRYFVNEDLAAENERQLGDLLREHNYNIGGFLQTLFLSRDFYRKENIGSRIKSPVEMVVSTYRNLNQTTVPGIPDFNVVTGALGQRLMHPPTVAGWSQGRSWITPSLLFERGNFVLDVLFPDIGFIPPDRYPVFTPEVVNVQSRLRQGMSISRATKPTGVEDGMEMAASNMLADRDEAFNTRLGSMRGWQMAIQRVKPIPRHTASVSLTAEVVNAKLTTPRDVVDYFAAKYFSVDLDRATLVEITDWLEAELGTSDIAAAESFAEEPLRRMLHRLLSLPEYQLG